MDTINNDTMLKAADAIANYGTFDDLVVIHTVTIELNGEHGGADLIVKGFDSMDVSLCNERTIKRVLR